MPTTPRPQLYMRDEAFSFVHNPPETATQGLRTSGGGNVLSRLWKSFGPDILRIVLEHFISGAGEERAFRSVYILV